MKPLNVALVVKHSSTSVLERDCRNMGYWSYPVPEFEWTHFDGFDASILNEFDVVIQEDAGPKRYSGLRKPLVYVAIDSTLSPDHLNARLPRAGNANLILVDHGPLDDFYQLNIPTLRWNYCVNDHLMKEYGEDRDIDVSFLCGGRNSPERKRLREILSKYCEERDLTFASGVLHPTDYARAMARSKIVVNWPRSPRNRPHRVFDALACGACLVTGPLPDVPGDNLLSGRDYFEVGEIEEVTGAIDNLFELNDWIAMGQRGKKTVMRYHTWAIRARQLRDILESELGLR